MSISELYVIFICLWRGRQTNGVTLPGLVKRCVAEAMLFIDGNYLESIEDPYGEEAIGMYEEFLRKYDQKEWIPKLR